MSKLEPERTYEPLPKDMDPDERRELLIDRKVGGQARRFKATPDFVKLRAMQIYAQHGPEVAARRMGVNRKTIDRWRHDLGLPSKKLVPVSNTDVESAVRQIQAARMDLKGMMINKTRMVLSMMTEEKKGSELRDLASAAGLLVDKFRLEMGEATEHTMRQSITAQMEPKEMIRAMRALSDELTNRPVETDDRTVDGDAVDVSEGAA